MVQCEQGLCGFLFGRSAISRTAAPRQLPSCTMKEIYRALLQCNLHSNTLLSISFQMHQQTMMSKWTDCPGCQENQDTRMYYLCSIRKHCMASSSLAPEASVEAACSLCEGGNKPSQSRAVLHEVQVTQKIGRTEASALHAHDAPSSQKLVPTCACDAESQAPDLLLKLAATGIAMGALPFHLERRAKDRLALKIGASLISVSLHAQWTKDNRRLPYPLSQMMRLSANNLSRCDELKNILTAIQPAEWLPMVQHEYAWKEDECKCATLPFQLLKVCFGFGNQWHTSQGMQNQKVLAATFTGGSVSRLIACKWTCRYAHFILHVTFPRVGQ